MFQPGCPGSTYPHPSDPPILFTADVSGGPFAVGDTIGLTLTLHNTTDYPLSSAQLDLPYQEHLLYQSGPGFKDAAAAEGTVPLGDLLLSHTFTLTAQLIATPTTSLLELPLQVRTASTDPISTTVTLPISATLAAEGVSKPPAILTADPVQWQFTYTPPGTSGFTGAATYGYSFSLPPGLGGLAPSLSLGYSSRGADGLEFPATTSGFGAGWGMSLPEIVNNNASGMYDSQEGFNMCDPFNNSNFSLTLNGTTYHLKPYPSVVRHGLYTATGDPSLYIEFKNNATTNITGEYWLLRTPDGTTYTFGKSEQAEQVIAPLRESCNANDDQPLNEDTFAALKWKLENITDIYGRQVNYVYGTGCGRYTDNGDHCRRVPANPTVPESTTFDQPTTPAQSGDFRTEVDVVLDHVEYNYQNGTAQTTATFDYTATNWSLVRRDTTMSIGHYRPNRLIVRHAGQVVSAYTFTSGVSYHHLSAHSYEFWWLTSITPYGSNYNPTTGTGTNLPAQTFSYDQNSKACGPDVNEITRCVPLLTRVNNGYGGVTSLVYERYNDNGQLNIAGKWFVVKEIHTWDGVRTIYNVPPGVQAGSRLLYSRTGFTACYDKDNTPCRSLAYEASDALVGFNGLTTNIQGPNGAGNWTTLSRQEEQFDTANGYWLNGKTTQTRQLNPANNAELSKTVYNWEIDGPNDWDARLMEEHHYLYAEATQHTYTEYAYDNTYGAVPTPANTARIPTAMSSTVAPNKSMPMK